MGQLKGEIMKYTEIGKNIVLTEYDSFSVSQTLECGQCFRFEKLGNDDYAVIARNRLLHIYKTDEGIVFENTSKEDFENIWFDYFDFKRDYLSIKDMLSKTDDTLKSSIDYADGIRILNQDFFECLISFIISQNNRIPMIKKVVSNISKKYGSLLGSIDAEEYYSFPDKEALSKATEAELMECKTGFRAKYIIDAVDKLINGSINPNEFENMPTEDVRKILMEIKGVGPKVADCVMLFSLGRSDAFPTDVWVKRVMSYFYFNGEDTPIKEIHKLAYDKFGSYAGFAQQYLFNYAREFKIGANDKKEKVK